MFFVPPFANNEVSQIRAQFRRFFPAADYATEFLVEEDSWTTSYLMITDKKHKIKFEVTTLRSPKEEFNEKIAKLVLMQRAVTQKMYNCLNPLEFV